jgi:hypothetical protein
MKTFAVRIGCGPTDLRLARWSGIAFFKDLLNASSTQPHRDSSKIC